VIRAEPQTLSSTELVVDVRHDDRPARPLLFRSPDPLWTNPPSTLDFAAIALAQYAAAHGEDLHLVGPVTAALLDNLDEYLQIWSVWRPAKFARVHIHADEEVSEPALAGRRGAVMGFSGGVDAAFALAAHSSRAVGRLSRQIELGVLVLGWDIRPGDDEAARTAADSVRQSLAAYGSDCAVVSTNWQQDFCPAWFMMFNAGLTSILRTLSDQYSSIVHATDKNYAQEFRQGPYGSSMAINHLLGTPGFPVVSTGGTHRRLERVAFLGDHPQLLDRLRVCFAPDAAGANCGRCEKCVRTQLELMAAGVHSAAFPEPLTQEMLDRVQARNPRVIPHYVDVLAHLPAGDPWRARVEAWITRERATRDA
jgi:hypothetical protein